MANFCITGFISYMDRLNELQTFHNSIQFAPKTLNSLLKNKTSLTFGQFQNINIGRDIVRGKSNNSNFAQGFIRNYKNYVNEVLENNLDKIELTKNLTSPQKQDFLTNIEPDKASFCSLIFGDKPTFLLCGDLDYLKPTKEYDILKRKIHVSVKDKDLTFDNTFILNKEKTKQTISDNIEFYKKRLNMKSETSVDEVYETLIGKNSPLLTNDKHDIIGITLGFSPINSVLFQLEQASPNIVKNRKDLDKYKKLMLNELLSEESPYNDFSQGFKNNVASAIRGISDKEKPFRNNFAELGYSSINIVDDDTHNQKIVRSILKTFHNIKSLING